MSLEDRITAIEGEIIELRRELHRYPELGFAEFTTAKIVADYLEDCGYSVQRGIGDTGVIGPWPCGPVWTPSPSKRPPGWIMPP